MTVVTIGKQQMMNHNYDKAINELMVKHLNTDYLNDSGYRNSFGLFSAALFHLLPDKSYRQHIDLYREYLFHRQWASLDLSFCVQDDPFIVEGWDDILTQLRDAAPAIIGSFHYGSYRLLPYLLHKHRIPFCMLVRRDVKHEQLDYFNALLDTHDDPQPLFTMLDAEDPLAALRVRRMLRDGYHVLSYFDGLQTVQTIGHHNGVTLMDAQIRVREGLPYLAARFDVNLMAILLSNKGETRRRLYHRTWSADQVRDSGAMPLMQEIFSWFEHRMRRDPMAWENWGEMHRLLYIPEPCREVPPSVFDPQQCSLLAFGKSRFILDKQTLKSYKIDEKVFEDASLHWLGAIAVDS